MLGQVAPAADVPCSAILPVHDQRRDPNQGKYVTHVDVDVHSDVGGGRAGADTEPKDTGNALEFPLRRARVGHADELVGESGIAPATLRVVGLSLRLLPGRKPRQARALHETRRGIHQDQPCGPRGIRGCEQDGEWGGIAEAEKHRPLRPDCVEDSADVVHARLQRGYADVPVGHAGPTLVDPEQATTGSEPVHESSLGGNLPIQLDVRDHIDRNEVGWTVADYLIGDIDVATLRISRFRWHQRSVAQFSSRPPAIKKKALSPGPSQ